MTSWLSHLPKQARILVLLAASMTMLVVLVLLVRITVVLADGVGRISSTEPRIARLLGYELAAQELQVAANKSRTTLANFAFDASVSSSQRGAELQRALRGFASDAGLNIVGSQFLTEVDASLPESDTFTALGVDLTMAGPPIALDEFLTQVYEYRPALKVVSLDIQQPRRQQRSRSGGVVSNLDGINIRAQIVGLMVAE